MFDGGCSLGLIKVSNYVYVNIFADPSSLYFTFKIAPKWCVLHNVKITCLKSEEFFSEG